MERPASGSGPWFSTRVGWRETLQRRQTRRRERFQGTCDVSAFFEIHIGCSDRPISASGGCRRKGPLLESLREPGSSGGRQGRRGRCRHRDPPTVATPSMRPSQDALVLSVSDSANFCFGGEVPIMVYDARRKVVEVLSGQGIIRAKDVVIGIASSRTAQQRLHARPQGAPRRRPHVGDGPRPGIQRHAGRRTPAPTRIYAAAIARLLPHYKVKHILHGIANITGGGCAAASAAAAETL